VSKLRVLSFAVSIGGFGAGPKQDLQNLLDVCGPELMDWFFHTPVYNKIQAPDGHGLIYT
jgi:hypothetical protein